MGNRVKFSAAVIAAAGLLLVWAYTSRGMLANVARDLAQEIASPLPKAVSYQQTKQAIPPSAVRQSPAPSGRAEATKTSADSLPQEMNLDVPFTSQAPFENWDLPYKETCEEAALLMVDRFYKGERFTRQSADNAILALTAFQRGRFGYYEDTTADETATIAREYFGYAKVRVVSGPITAEMIKREIARGHPVVLPMAGRLLGNIYYRRPGPYYHMLVVKGYTPTEFITNDPGTKRGHNYRYPYQTLLNAIHDFHPIDITSMPQAMMVIEPN